MIGVSCILPFKHGNKYKLNFINILFLLYICFTFTLLYSLKNIIVIFLIVIMLLSILTQKNSKISFYFIWSIGFSFICIISALWSPTPSYSLKIAMGFLEIVIIGFVFLSQRFEYKKIEFYLKAIIFAGILFVVRILIEFPISSWGISRLHNENLNSNSIGMLLMFATLCSYHLYKYTQKRKYLLIILPFIIIILFTGSRKAFIGIVLGFIYLWWIYIKKKTLRLMAIPITIGLLVITVILVLNIPFLYNILGYRLEGLLNIFGNKSNTDASTIIRSQMISVGWKIFLQRPILGHGLYSYESLSGFGTYAHNNYIELLTSIGFIGTIWYYSIYIYNIKKLIKYVKMKYAHAFLFLCIFAIQVILDFAVVNWSSESIHFLIILSTWYVDNMSKTIKKESYTIDVN